MSAINFECLPSAPSAPDSGRVKLYADSSCSLYLIDSSGNIVRPEAPYESFTIDEDYTVGSTEDALRVTGNRTITLPLTRSKPVAIYAATGTVTLSVNPENVPNPITSGNSYTLIYDSTLGGYWAQ